jgi:agarase
MDNKKMMIIGILAAICCCCISILIGVGVFMSQSGTPQASGTPPASTRERPTGFFAIKHNSGKCIHPQGGTEYPTNGTIAVLFDGCDEKKNDFELTSNGSLKHSSGMCLRARPNTGTGGLFGGLLQAASGLADNNAELIFVEDCEGRGKFEFLGNGAIKHVNSDKCIHPSGGSDNPANDTKLVVYDGCDDNKVKFSKIF